jgi:hypothetical protein
VLLYTLPKAYQHLRHDVESNADSNYSLAKQTIRSFKKSSTFAASLSANNEHQAVALEQHCEHGRSIKKYEVSSFVFATKRKKAEKMNLMFPKQ